MKHLFGFFLGFFVSVILFAYIQSDYILTHKNTDDSVSTGVTETGFTENPPTDIGFVEKEETECKKGFVVRYTFNELALSKYTSYTQAKNYCFAHKIIGTKDGVKTDLGYIDVFRNLNNGVSNSKHEGLDGCTKGYTINFYSDNGFRVFVGDQYPFAREQGEYGYVYKTIPDFENIEVLHSPTKEGVKLIDYTIDEICM